MDTKLTKIASIIAFIIGAMAIFAGGKVLIGLPVDYYVIDWLPTYNFTLGLISAGFTAIVIWKGNKFAMPAALATFASHATVMLIIQTAYKDVVAPDSTQAMTLRLSVWFIILALMFIQARKNKQSSN